MGNVHREAIGTMWARWLPGAQVENVPMCHETLFYAIPSFHAPIDKQTQIKQTIAKRYVMNTSDMFCKRNICERS